MILRTQLRRNTRGTIEQGAFHDGAPQEGESIPISQLVAASGTGIVVGAVGVRRVSAGEVGQVNVAAPPPELEEWECEEDGGMAALLRGTK